MALRVEKLFQDYNNPGSYAVASVLTLMALSTLVLKIILERMVAASMEQSSAE
jgi:sulfate transport system permease protein